MTDQKKIIDVGSQDNYFEYHQSANTLFHFMGKLEYLLLSLKKICLFPRYVLENVEYLNLEYKEKQIKWVSFPMLCFCDINFHMLSMHAEGNPLNGNRDGYGTYGLGLDKKWCEQNGLQPISYLNGKASQTESLRLLFNRGLDLRAQKKFDESNEDLYDFIFTQVALSKPLGGKMRKGENEVQKNFHDEREWRFLPNLEGLSSPEFLNDVTDPQYMDYASQRDLSSGLQVEEGTHLKLEIDIIKYIIVKSEDDRAEVITLLDKQFSRSKALGMASKIVVYDQMVKDW
ncbi:abortive infection system antitoxin AbiGi family protein [Listeria costaricensis]|uniref:abortive infection system antitoxin AbiGi family protein n=1 Tax=Listeria costaricensis TaxID=2026604 RepID=UPI000C075F22|nr:abortive infection system antitoxin AbiGi family protein [Listeria costaricensis]